MSTDSKPQSGRLATHQDLELFMDLQAWLNATDPNKLGVHDSWAVTDTDNAFAFNNEMGVQMTHADNRWVSGSDSIKSVKFMGMLPWGSEPVISQDLSLNGRGLYVYISKGPYVIMELKNPVTTIQVVAEFEEDNRSEQPKNFEYTYSKTTTQSTSLTVSETTALKVESKFELDGFSFGVEASFDRSRTTENSQATSVTTTVTESTTIEAHKKFAYKVREETTTTETLYGLDFRIGGEVALDGTVTGGLAKATQFPNETNFRDLGYYNTWDRIFPIEQFINPVQTAKYHVVTQHMVTKIDTSTPN